MDNSNNNFMGQSREQLLDLYIEAVGKQTFVFDRMYGEFTHKLYDAKRRAEAHARVLDYIGEEMAQVIAAFEAAPEMDKDSAEFRRYTQEMESIF